MSWSTFNHSTASMAFDQYDFYKDMYEFELERMTTLNSSVSTPLTVLTALGSVIVFFIKDNTPHLDSPWQWVYLILLIGSSVSFVFTLVYLFRSYHNKDYALLDSLGEYHEWRKELDDILKDKALTDVEFENGLVEKLIEPTDYNREINNQKSANLHNAKTCLIVTIVVTILCSVPYMLTNYDRPKSVYRVAIVPDSDAISKKLMPKPTTTSSGGGSQSGGSATSSSTTSSGSASSSTVTLPSPPPTVFIRSNTGKPK